jgi:hypothetical protein
VNNDQAAANTATSEGDNRVEGVKCHVKGDVKMNSDKFVTDLDSLIQGIGAPIKKKEQ